MQLGDGLQLRSSLRSNPLGPCRPCILCTWQAGAHLEAGCNLAATGATLCAAERISIGDNVVIGANSVVIDTDFHPLDPRLRKERTHQAGTAPVVIEDDVFIGMNCVILKGVTLGRGCVIGAGSVVTRAIPPMTRAAGNPARIVGPSDGLSSENELF
jgi:acetyltransferase-like isoleucine patch superfamily enzyme